MPFYENSSKVIALCEDKKIKGYVTPSILMDLHYIFARMSHSNKNADLAIQEIMKVFDVIDISYKDIHDSTIVHKKDFEDSVILQSSVRNKLNCIVTRNTKDFENSREISIVEPEELLSLYTK